MLTSIDCFSEALFSVIPDLFFCVEPSGKIIHYKSGNNHDLYVDPSVFMHKRMQDVLPVDIGKKFDAAISKAMSSCQLQVFEYELSVSGENKYFEARLNKLPNIDMIPIIVRDITDQKNAEELLAKHAYYDDLTDIPNHRFAMHLIEKQVSDCERRGESFAVSFIDLNKFKAVNDVFGHNAGDTLLKEVARRCGESLRASDTVARIGGDEFIILMGGNPTEADIIKTLTKTLNLVEKPIELGKYSQQVSPQVSIGVAIFPADSKDASGLLSCSDSAMYQAKSSHRTKISFFKDVNL